LADTLTGHGFDVLDPDPAAVHHLKITNVPGALCDLDLHASGRIEMNYRLGDPCEAEPDRLAQVVTILLGAEEQASDPPDRGRAPAPHGEGTVWSAACRLLAAIGLRIQVDLRVDQFRYEVYSAADVTNPMRPERGIARIFDDNSIQWSSDLADPVGNLGGLAPREVAELVARALD